MKMTVKKVKNKIAEIRREQLMNKIAELKSLANIECQFCKHKSCMLARRWNRDDINDDDGG